MAVVGGYTTCNFVLDMNLHSVWKKGNREMENRLLENKKNTRKILLKNAMPTTSSTANNMSALLLENENWNSGLEFPNWEGGWVNYIYLQK